MTQRITIGFTGHRDKVANEADLLAIEKEYPGAIWIHGGAEGFDSQVDGVALALGKKRWETLIVMRPEYNRYAPRVAPLKRNEAIVDRVDLLVALYDGRETGGTHHTVKYAKSRVKIRYLTVKE